MCKPLLISLNIKILESALISTDRIKAINSLVEKKNSQQKISIPLYRQTNIQNKKNSLANMPAGQSPRRTLLLYYCGALRDLVPFVQF